MKQTIINHFSNNFYPFYEMFLPGIKKDGGNSKFKAVCPFHDDKDPSLKFTSSDGRFKCFGCDAKGDIFSFYAKKKGLDVNASFPDVLSGICREFGIAVPEKPTARTKTYQKSKPFVHFELGEPVKKYPYTDKDGNVLYYNCRFEPKAFRPCTADGKIWAIKDINPKVPYNLPEILKADEVCIVESEKDCINLEKIHVVGTCSVGGAGTWTPDLNEHFRDKEVVILPDNDDAGHKHTAKVYSELKDVASSVSVVHLPDLAEKGDFTDWLDTFDNMVNANKNLLMLIDNAPPYYPEDGEIKTSIIDVILTADRFHQLRTAERHALLHPWLKEESINLLNGWRGLGKTWLALALLNAITKGESFGPWECEKSVPCLFLDGEMVVSDDIDRINALRLHTERKNPLYIYSDALANQKGLPRAHLANKNWRETMKQILLDLGIKFWVADNLASLASGLDENSKQDWDPVNQWLLELRFAGIATLMPHHLGKGGNQRGTSAREDNIDISIDLKIPHDYTREDGARFIVSFSKARVKTSYLSLITDTEFKLILDEPGQYIWTYKDVKQSNKYEVLRLLDEGMDQKDIKDILGITKGSVSKNRNKLINEGLLTDKNKLTQAGFMALNR